ncbi:MAG: hypothetical protein ABH848_04790, partial [Candidatus Omnitrophota bacterium]
MKTQTYLRNLISLNREFRSIGLWRRFRVFSLILALTGGVYLLSLCPLLTPDAEAVQVKKIWRGTVSFGTADYSKAVEIDNNPGTTTTIDTTKAVILISWESANPNPSNSLFVTDFEGDEYITILRWDVDTAATVAWTVIEFDEDVLVQRGNFTIGAGTDPTNYSKLQGLSASIDQSKSFIIMYYMGSTRNTNNTEFMAMTSRFSANNQLTFKRRAAYQPLAVYWQAVEFQTDTTVQHNNSSALTIGSGSLSNTASIDLSTIDPSLNKSFLVVSSNANPSASGNVGQWLTRGVITNTSTLTFTRESSTNDTEIHYFLVTLTDDSSVQKNSQTMTTVGPTSVTGYSAIDPDRAFPIFSVSSNGGFKDIDAFVTRATIASDGSTFVFDRDDATVNATLAWFVPELAPFNLTYPVGGETFKVGTSETMTWTSSSTSRLTTLTLEWSDDDGLGWNEFVGGTAITPGNKEFDWLVPTVTTEKEEDCLIKISNNNGSYPYSDETPSNLTIKSNLKMTEPDTGEGLWANVGDSKLIQWTADGNFDSTVKLQYSTTSDHLEASWTDNTITGAETLTATDEQFYWNPIPLEASGTTTRIRVISNTNADVKDPSDEDFEIRGTIAIDFPVGAPSTPTEWLTGYTRNITWTLNCNSTLVHIEYSTDGGSEFSDVVASTNAQSIDSTHGDYGLWFPPLTVSTSTAQIRITDTSDSNLTKTTGNFTITPSVIVTGPPAAGDLWLANQSKDINFTIGGTDPTINNVDIYYTKDFTTYGQNPDTFPTGYTQIANDIAADPGANTWPNWLVEAAATTSEDVRIAVADSGFASTKIFDTGPDAGSFKIKPNIVISAPASGSVVNTQAGTTIYWDTYGTVSSSAMQLQYYNGSAWVGKDPNPYIYNDINPDISSSKAWASADIPTTNLNNLTSKVRIIHPTDTDMQYESAQFYTRGHLWNIDTKNTGDTPTYSFNIGDTCRITWSYYPDPWPAQDVTIQYAIDAGTGSWNDITSAGEAQAADGTYDWLIPSDVTLDDDIKIKILADGDSTGQCLATATNTISVLGSLNWVVPSENGGDAEKIYKCGDANQTFTWSRQGATMGSVAIVVSLDGTDNWPVTITPAGGVPAFPSSFTTWTVPVLAPDETGSLLKSADYGRNTQIKFKVYEIAYGDNVSKQTSQPVTILSQLTGIAPSTGTINIGTTKNITWTTKGAVDTIHLVYDKTNEDTFGGTITTDPITNRIAGLPATYVDSYAWVVDCPLDSNIVVRVQSADDGGSNSAYIQLDSGDLVAKGTLEMLLPDDTKVNDSSLIAGDTYTVTWLVNGGKGKTAAAGKDLGNLALYSSLDSYTTPISNTIACDGPSSYEWFVPVATSIPSAGVQLKIEDVDETGVNDLSEAFDIRGRIWNGTLNHNMVVPNGGEPYLVGNTITVQWRYNGSGIGNCTIELDEVSGTGGWNYVPAISPVPYNSNESVGLCSYDVAVPADSGVNYKLRISAISDTTYVYAQSQTDWIVKGNVILTSPDTDTPVWAVDGSSVSGVTTGQPNITFNTTGGVNVVDIFFDNNSGGSFYPLQITNPATGYTMEANPDTYEWTIGTTDYYTVSSEACKIKVADHNDGSGTVYDTTTDDFTIVPTLTIGNEITGATEAEMDSALGSLSWTWKGTVANVRIYSTNDSWSTPYERVNSMFGGAETSPAGCGGNSWNWNPITGTNITAASQASIKIVRLVSGVEDPNVTCQTPLFTIKGKITVTSPVSAQVYNVYSTGSINWTISGDVNNIGLQYQVGYTDGSGAWSYLLNTAGDGNATNIAAGSGPYEFTLTGNTGANVKLRVLEESPPTAVALGPDVHSVIGDIIFDQGDTEDQTYVVGTTDSISWSKVGTFTDIVAEYELGKGTGYSLIANLGDVNTVNFLPKESDITNTSGTNKVFFQVRDAYNSNVAGETTGTSGNIVWGSLALTAPSVPAEFTVNQSGTTTNIKWLKQGLIGNLKFELWDGNAWITGTTAGLNADYSQVPGLSGVEQTFSPAWVVPDQIGTGRKLRVTGLEYDDSGYEAGAYPWATDTSGTFTIKGSFISITDPDPATATWYVGETHNITWNANGKMKSVSIQMYDGTQWRTIDGTYTTLSDGANTFVWAPGHTAWSFQEVATENCVIRLTGVTGTGVTIKTSDETIPANGFTLMPKITITAPTAGASWISGTTGQTISWTPIEPPTTNVVITLDDKDAGAGYPLVLTNNTVDNGSFINTTAVIPATLTTRAFIEIKDQDAARGTFVLKESGEFNVIGSYSLDPMSDDPQDYWKVGDTARNITWSKTGNMGTDTRIYANYDYDAGEESPGNAAWGNAIGSNIDCSSGTWSWNPIPDQVSAKVAILITDGDRTTTKSSDMYGSFNIIGGFQFVAPIQNQLVQIDNDSDPTGLTIQWYTFGSAITQAELAYATNAPTYDNWTTIKTGITTAYWGSTPGEHTELQWNVTGAGITGPIPVNLATKNIKLRVIASTPNQPETNELSPVFWLGGKIIADTPATEWVVGTTESISWSKYGKIDEVKITYSKDSGTPYAYVIATNADADNLTQNTGSFDWGIPAGVGSDSGGDLDLIPQLDSGASNKARINIADANALFTSDILNPTNTFNLKGVVALNAATLTTLGNDIVAGVSPNITYTRQGRIEAIDVLYASDGTNFAGNTIVAGETFSNPTSDTQKTVQWTVPESQTLATTYKIRVQDSNYVYADGGASGTYYETPTPSAFTVKGALTVTEPDTTSRNIYLGGTHEIKWDVTHGYIQNVRIEFSPSGDFEAAAGGDDTYLIISSTDADNLRDVTDALSPPGLGSYVWGLEGTGGVIKDRTPTLNTSDAITGKVRIKEALPAFNVEDESNSQTVKIIDKIIVNDSTLTPDWIVGETTHQVKFTSYGTSMGTVGIFLYDGVSVEYRLDNPSNGGVATAGDSVEQTFNVYISELPAGIPDIKNNSCTIRVRDADTGITGTSGIFSVYPEITNVGITPTNPPNIADTWIADNVSQEVTWTETSANITLVDIYYATSQPLLDTGTLLKDQAPSAQASSQNWNGIDLTGFARTHTAWIRVQDDASAFSANVKADFGPFDLLGEITITQPTVGTSWELGTTKYIKWDYKGNMANVKIYADLAGLNTFLTEIDTGAGIADGQGTGYPWYIPNSVTTGGAEIKIYDANALFEATIVDTSGDFNIVGGFEFVYPSESGGETFHIDNDTNPTAMNIQWFTFGNDITAVGLDYWNGGSWITLDGNFTDLYYDTGNTNTFSWDINDTPALPINLALTSMKMRVYQITPAKPGNVPEHESGAFVMCGTLEFEAGDTPDTSSEWTVGGTGAITWHYYGPVSNVKLSYQKASDGWITNIINSGNPWSAGSGNTGSYDWSIPTNVTLNLIPKTDINERAFVKIADSAGSFGTYVYDQTGGSGFKLKGKLELHSDTLTLLGNDVVAGIPALLKVTRYGQIEEVNIRYDFDGGTTFPGTITTSALTFPVDQTLTSTNWNIPGALTLKTTYEILVEDANYVYVDSGNPGTSYKTPSTFVVDAQLDLDVPDDETPNIAIGSTYKIMWYVNWGNLSNVKIEISPNGTFNDTFLIRSSTPAFNESAWNGGGSSPVGAGSYIWGIDEVGGVIVDDTPTLITNAQTGKVRITNAAAGFSATNQSPSGVVTMIGGLSVTTPGTWRVGDTNQDIQWTAYGDIQNVKIQLNDGLISPNVYTIGTTVASGPGPKSIKTAAWETYSAVPDIKSENCTLIITDVANGTVTKTSGAFSIYPSISNAAITPTDPTKANIWEAVSTSNEVTWYETSSKITKVDIYYSSTDAAGLTPGTLLTPAAGVPSNLSGANSYSDITAPAARTLKGIIRVQDHDETGEGTFSSDGEVEDESGLFNVVANITFAGLSAGDSWAVESTQYIDWTYTSDISNVSIYVDYDYDIGSPDFSSIVQENVLVTLGDGAGYPWSIPNEISNKVKIQITDAATAPDDYKAVTKYLSPLFNIVGGFEFVTPSETDGVTEFQITSDSNPASMTIQWFTFGDNITAVTLKYYDHNSTSWVLIQDDVLNDDYELGDTNEYTWSTASTGPLPVNLSEENVQISISSKVPLQPGNVPAHESGTFKMYGTLAFEAGDTPDSNTVWTVGDTDAIISWHRHGDVPQIKLSYKKASDAYLTTIINSGNPINSDNNYVGTTMGSYTWTVPTATTIDIIPKLDAPDDERAYIRIQDSDSRFAGLTTAVSDPFKVKGKLELTSATLTTLSNDLIPRSNYNIIVQRYGKILNVDVTYADDGVNFTGSIQEPLTFSGTDATATANWTVPSTSTLATTYKIKVENVNHVGGSGTYYVTPEPDKFTVKPQLDLTNPDNETPTIAIGSTYKVTWNVLEGNIVDSFVRIEFSPSGDFEGAAGGDDTYLIKAQADPFNETAWNGGGTSPVGAGSYIWGSETSGIVDRYTGAGSIITNAQTGKVRIKDSDTNFSVSDESPNPVVTITGDLAVTTPSTWRVGDTNQNIQWTASGDIQNVKVEINDGLTVDTDDIIITTTPSDNGPNTIKTAVWEVEGAVPDWKSNYCTITITDVDNLSVTKTSGAFSILPSISNVTLTPTTGHEGSDPVIWLAQNTSHTVSWTETSSKITHVDVYYSSTDFAGLPGTNLTSSGVVSDQSGVNSTSTITVPTNRTLEGMIRVRDRNNDVNNQGTYYDDGEVEDESALFYVLADIDFTAPASGTYWSIDTTQDIKWTSTSDITLIDIYANVDDNADFEVTVKTGADVTLGPGAGWPWSVPNAVRNTAQIRITDNDNPPNFKGALDYISDDFSIVGGFEFVYPSEIGGEIFHINDDTNPTPMTIKWFTTGNSITSVKLEYWDEFIGATGTWIGIDSSANNNTVWGIGNTNTFTWDKDDTPALPQTLASTAIKMRLTQNTPAKPAGLDEDTFVSGTFVIGGTLEFEAGDTPDSNSVWTVGDTQATISWHYYGPVTNVLLSYKKTGASYDSSIINSGNSMSVGTTNTGSYDWTVPTATTIDIIPKLDNPDNERAYIKIQDDNGSMGASIYDESDPFKVKGRLELTAATLTTLSTDLLPRSAYDIIVQRYGQIPNVDVTYAADGVNFTGSIQEPLVFSGTDATATKSWTVPSTATLSTTYEIRVENVNHVGGSGTYYETLEADRFTVKPKLDLTNPDNETPTIAIGSTYKVMWNVDEGNIINSFVRIEFSPSGDFEGAAGGDDTYLIKAQADPFNESAWNLGVSSPVG